MEWLVHELASRAGISTRTLRHYDAIGLLTPTRVGTNGYRRYGPDAVARLQRILLLRDLGLGLPVIAAVLAEEIDELQALSRHIAELEASRARTERRIRAVEHTLEARRQGVEPCPDIMLDGFNDRYEEEVVARWGERAYRVSNEWWHSLPLSQQRTWKDRGDDLVADWISAWREGTAPDSPVAQELAARHVGWLGTIPGTPLHDDDQLGSVAMLRGLGAMYVGDPRFARTYGGRDGARFVRDALEEYLRTAYEGASPERAVTRAPGTPCSGG
ncbi:MAG: MerR family transcriptional regulator, thiopeptide resistance regulator [Actinomycetota bacterium]|nr:MerR family transcriptional regulator, thiopeptide resistance regulator [Actinomycetota bacterium]